MEVIGRGKDKVGSVWVAIKVPDGYIAAHSNQASQDSQFS
jgi:dipeptidase